MQQWNWLFQMYLASPYKMCIRDSRYTGADSMELEQLKADIAAFLSANDVSEDQIFYSSNYFDMQGFKLSLIHI